MPGGRRRPAASDAPPAVTPPRKRALNRRGRKAGGVTNVFITIDTEYSAGLHQRGATQAENFARSIACETSRGSVGIEYQMDVFDRHGLTGVFFVDPMPALLWGTEAIAAIVRPVLARGHEVQCHVHAEWLQFAPAGNPLGLPAHRNIADYEFEQQVQLLTYARDVLVEAGAPAPIAFRAGNYGANDDTLRALRWAGMRYDTSHCPGIATSDCRISLGAEDRAVMHHAGALEVPVGAVRDWDGSLRHAQLTALSHRELTEAVLHARDAGLGSFTVVSHSFELLSRDRSRVNEVVKRRFERFCRDLERIRGVEAKGYMAAPPMPPRADGWAPTLPANRLRSAERMAQQAISNLLYGRG